MLLVFWPLSQNIPMLLSSCPGIGSLEMVARTFVKFLQLLQTCDYKSNPLLVREGGGAGNL